MCWAFWSYKLISFITLRKFSAILSNIFSTHYLSPILPGLQFHVCLTVAGLWDFTHFSPIFSFQFLKNVYFVLIHIQVHWLSCHLQSPVKLIRNFFFIVVIFLFNSRISIWFAVSFCLSLRLHICSCIMCIYIHVYFFNSLNKLYVLTYWMHYLNILGVGIYWFLFLCFLEYGLKFTLSLHVQ